MGKKAATQANSNSLEGKAPACMVMDLQNLTSHEKNVPEVKVTRVLLSTSKTKNGERTEAESYLGSEVDTASKVMIQ